MLPDSLFPNRFPQLNKNATPPENLSDFWPDGLSENSDLCSKYWLPRMTEAMEDSVFRHYYAMKVVPKHLVIILVKLLAYSYKERYKRFYA